MKIRTYDELITLPTFKERFEYLKIGGKVGEETFGTERWINQRFYKSDIWLEIKDKVIIRDLGCDLGLPGYELSKRIVVHHMNPITVDDIINLTDFAINPKYLITMSDITHKAIHYGCYDLLAKDPVIRRANDTCPWRH